MPHRALEILYVRRADAGCVRPKVRNAADAAALFRSAIGGEAVEVFAVLCLTTKRDVIGYHEVGRGTLDAAPVHPRDVFKVALYANAASVVLGHNHPSGDASPSPEDVSLTTRLAKAGRLLGIEVTDHVIVAGDAHVSLRDAGLLRE
jgi:DNA repair protein RadC